MDPLDAPMTEENDYLPDSEERMWATFAHLGIIAGLVIPLGNIIAPLVIWLIKKDESAYVDYHGKEALNFQLTMTLAMFVSAILIFVLIGIPLLIVVAIADLILSIMAAVRANEGEHYRYPFNIRFIQ
jgi:uncharacterized Tic20 family protein